jgi:hypothetical protein
MTRSSTGRRARWIVAGVLAVAVLVAAGALLNPASRSDSASGAASGPAGSHAWVSPSGDDGAACTQASPCRSLNRAVGRVGPGGVVLLTDGTYPAQEIRGGVRAGGRKIVLKPAPGARKVFIDGRLALHATGLELRGLRMVGWYAFADAGRLTFRDVTAKWFFVDSASDLKILGGSVGPSDGVDPQIRAADRVGAAVPRNVLIDGVRFHDFTKATDPAAHVECLQFGAGRHVVVRRSTFYNCADHSVFVGAWGGTATVKDFTFEDNHFAEVKTGYYSLRVAADDPKVTSGIVVRHNTASTTMRVDPSVSGVVWEDNLSPRFAWECFPSQRYRGNVWVGAKAAACSKSDRLGSSEAAVIALARDPKSKPGVAGLRARG